MRGGCARQRDRVSQSSFLTALRSRRWCTRSLAGDSAPTVHDHRSPKRRILRAGTALRMSASESNAELSEWSRRALAAECAHMDPASFATVDSLVQTLDVGKREEDLIRRTLYGLDVIFAQTACNYPYRVLPEPTQKRAPKRSGAAARDARRAVARALRNGTKYDYTEEEYQADVYFSRWEFMDDPGREDALRILLERRCATEKAKWMEQPGGRQFKATANPQMFMQMASHYAWGGDGGGAGDDGDDDSDGGGGGDRSDGGGNADDDVAVESAEEEAGEESASSDSDEALPTVRAVRDVIRTLRVQQRVLRHGEVGDATVTAASVTLSFEGPQDAAANERRSWLQVRVVAREDIYPEMAEGEDVSGRDESVARIYFRAGKMGDVTARDFVYAGHAPFLLQIDEIDTSNRTGTAAASPLAQPLSDEFLRALTLTFPSVDPELSLYAIYLCIDWLLTCPKIAWEPFDPLGLGEWPDEHGKVSLSAVPQYATLHKDCFYGCELLEDTGIGVYLAAHVLWLREGATTFAGVPFCTHPGELTRDIFTPDDDSTKADGDDARTKKELNREEIARLETACLKFRLGVGKGTAAADCPVDCGYVRGYLSDMNPRKRRRMCEAADADYDAETKRRRKEMGLQPGEMDPQSDEWWLYPGTLELVDPAYEARRIRSMRDCVVWTYRHDDESAKDLAMMLAMIRTRDEYEGHDGYGDDDASVSETEESSNASDEEEEEGGDEQCESDPEDQVLEERFQVTFAADESPAGRIPGWEVMIPNTL